MGNYKVLKNLRPNIEYAELLRKVASKIEILEEPIASEMVEQIKELSKNAIKQGEKEKIEKENEKKDFFRTAMNAMVQEYEKQNNAKFKEEDKAVRNDETVEIHPLMPTRYNQVERTKLRKFEKELLAGRESELDI